MSDADPLSVDYESPFPECRVLSTVDPRALIRLDVNRSMAALLAERFQATLDGHDGDGLVTLGVTVQEPTYERFATQVETLVWYLDQTTDDELVSAQVLVDRDLTPGDPAGVSLSVIINESQLRDLYRSTEAALAKSNGDLHRWEFSATFHGGQLLVKQLAAAVRGVDDPLEDVLEDAEEVTPGAD